MRKIALLVMGLFISITVTNAQDTLIFEDFNDTIIGTTGLNYYEIYPNSVLNDTNWYNYDEDMIPDASGSSRPDLWWLSAGGFSYPDTNDICLFANSWTNDGTNPVSNWLVLPAIQITDGASAWLKWKSAPRQTPYYLDGFEIVISTTTNDLANFTNVAYTAAEYMTGAATGGNTYSNYTFSAGWQHGADGLFVQCDTCTVPTSFARQIGIQRPDSVSLATYDNMKIYIAFHHNSHDDNLISLDDILVIENTDITFSIDNNQDIMGSVYPNPATDYTMLNFDMNAYHNLHVQLFNSNGQVMYSSVLTTQNQRIDLTNISAGIYIVKVIADEGSMTKKLIVNK
jgi:hypothetical protein